MKHIVTEIEIREIVKPSELEMVRNLEARVWGSGEAVPVSQVVTTVKNGGFVLGAFFKNELVGFQYSFPGWDGKQVYLCSYSLGIDQNYRKFGIGEKLKWAQQRLAAKKGYSRITWTFDPLETVNGYLNLHKLGGTCSTYMENVYGEMEGLNAGVPTDRFLVEWNSNQVKADGQVSTENLRYTITTFEKDGFLIPNAIELTLEEPKLFVPVPGDFQTIKRQNLQLAIQWREQTRKVFSHYFSNGWVATDLAKDLNVSNQYCYILEKPRS